MSQPDYETRGRRVVAQMCASKIHEHKHNVDEAGSRDVMRAYAEALLDALGRVREGKSRVDPYR